MHILGLTSLFAISVCGVFTASHEINGGTTPLFEPTEDTEDVAEATNLSRVLTEIDRRAEKGLPLDSLYNPRLLAALNGDLIEVSVVGPKGADPVHESLVSAQGGHTRLTWRHRALVQLPPARLVELALSLPVGYRMKLPGYSPPLGSVAGEGPAATGSDVYRDNGADGSGIKVAVLDNGYEGYLEAFLNGDVPVFEDYEIYNGGDLGDGGPHGTACVEQIFDHAPGADIYLVKMSSDNPTHLGNAVNWCIERDIDIITMSLSFYNGGWEDGSGDACDALDDATAAGILVFVAAGNFELQHWRGQFSDNDSDGWHNWFLNDETNHVDLDPQDWLDVHLQWDDPAGSSYTDYDVILYDSSFVEVDLGGDGQESGAEFESFFYTHTGTAAERYHVKVKHVSGTPVDFQLFQRAKGSSNGIEWTTVGGSVTSTAASTNPNVISVGAAPHGDFSTPPATGPVVTDWSSRGPTNSGNIKPEVVGPTYISCFVYPYVNNNPSATFGGTSCATPNVAGTAAALWSSLPNYSASGIRMLLLRQAQLIRDWGLSGEDDDHGHGGASLYPYHHDTAWVDRKVDNPLGLTLIPFAKVEHAYSHVPSGGRILFLGREYSETLTMDKDVLLDTVVEPAIIGN